MDAGDGAASYGVDADFVPFALHHAFAAVNRAAPALGINRPKEELRRSARGIRLHAVMGFDDFNVEVVAEELRGFRREMLEDRHAHRIVGGENHGSAFCERADFGGLFGAVAGGAADKRRARAADVGRNRMERCGGREVDQSVDFAELFEVADVVAEERARDLNAALFGAGGNHFSHSAHADERDFHRFNLQWLPEWIGSQIRPAAAIERRSVSRWASVIGQRGRR